MKTKDETISHQMEAVNGESDRRAVENANVDFSWKHVSGFRCHFRNKTNLRYKNQGLVHVNLYIQTSSVKSIYF